MNDWQRKARLFCYDFKAFPRRRYVFGCTPCASVIAESIQIAGFVDDTSPESHFEGIPVLRLRDLRDDALVVSSLLGRPLTGQKVLNKSGVRHLDFFAFYQYASLGFGPIQFWGNFSEEYAKRKPEYQAVAGRLADAHSKQLFESLLRFRTEGNISHISGFRECQNRQYFENFLALKPEGEVFVDIGGFDGSTSVEFIRRCPGYAGIHLFEPEPSNASKARATLHGYDKVQIYELGLGDTREEIQFSADGSTSGKDCHGGIRVQIDTLYSVLKGSTDQGISFIKMDIEGAESMAIEGAKQTILRYHPKLAICVYHKLADLRTIPEQVLGIRDDYDMYLRHYTEGVVETVMFFVPR